MPAASPFDRFKRVGTAMAILVILVAIAEFFWNASNPTDRDFISFWGAAQLALAGDPAAAYDQARLHEVQSAVVTFVNGDGMPFPYPPAFLLLVDAVRTAALRSLAGALVGSDLRSLFRPRAAHVPAVGVARRGLPAGLHQCRDRAECVRHRCDFHRGNAAS